MRTGRLRLLSVEGERALRVACTERVVACAGVGEVVSINKLMMELKSSSDVE